MKPQQVVRQDSRERSTQTHKDAAGLIGSATVMTLDGEKQVQDIKPGDMVITRDSGTARVASVRSRRVMSRMVTIRERALGHNRPEQEVHLPAGQPILIRDWRAATLFGAKQALVPASRLVDGEFVSVSERAEITVFEIEFDSPHLIYADGLEVASFFGGASFSKAA